METPYTLTVLARPLDPDKGKVRSAAVYGFGGSRKRKRNELVVGVDGDSISIQDIRSQSVVSTCVLPPQSYLCCAPTSACCKRWRPNRLTFAVLRELPRGKRAIFSFCESVESLQDAAVQTKSHVTRRLPLQDGDIVSLDTFGSDERLRVLVSYRNGLVNCVKGDVSKIEWRQWTLTAEERSSEQLSVDDAGVTDVAIARSGLLAGREDLLVQLDEKATLYYQVIKRLGRRWLRFHSINDENGVNLIASCKLPMAKGSDTQQYQMHISSAQLFELRNGVLSIYDLSLLAPRIVATFGPNVKSFARLGPSTVLVAHPDCLAIYETRFNTLQASLPLKTSKLQTMTYYSDIGLVAMLWDDEIKCMQLSEQIQSQSRRGVVLADIVSKGNGVNAKTSSKFEQWKKEVDEAESARLEGYLCNALGFKSPEGGEEILTSEVFKPALMDSKQVYYILTKLFHMAEGQPLQATSDNTKLYVWLALAGFLTAQSLQTALALYNPSSPTIKLGEIMSSIAVGTGLQTVHDLLALDIYWDIEEVMSALQALIRSFKTPDQEEGPLKALPSAHGEEDEAVAAAEQELNMAILALSSGLQVRSEALRHALRRLEKFSTDAVRDTMRAQVSAEEILFLMKILRIELKDGGWTRRYIDLEDEVDITDGDEEEDEERETDDSAGGSIGKLLGCAVDAIGISGWLVGQRGEQLGAEELLEGLRMEVGFAAEGLAEMKQLWYMLQEVVGYGHWIEKEGKKEKERRKENKKRKRQEEEEEEEDKVKVEEWLPLERKKVRQRDREYTFERIQV